MSYDKLNVAAVIASDSYLHVGEYARTVTNCKCVGTDKIYTTKCLVLLRLVICSF